MTIKVLIADDHPIFREGLARSLDDTRPSASSGRPAAPPRRWT
ncbi:MAG: hypothetical protein ACE368_24060 [Paracoccaceae bacterium]